MDPADEILIPYIISCAEALTKAIGGDKFIYKSNEFIKYSLGIVSEYRRREIEDMNRMIEESKRGDVKTSALPYLDYETALYAESENASVTASLNLIQSFIENSSSSTLRKLLFNDLNFINLLISCMSSNAPYLLNSIFGVIGSISIFVPDALNWTVNNQNQSFLDVTLQNIFRNIIPAHMLKKGLLFIFICFILFIFLFLF